jgi:hypothetical protein
MMKEMKLCLCRLQALITEDAAAGRIVCELPTLALAEPA